MSRLGKSVTALRPFIPAKDFAVSKRFYADFGFSISYEDTEIAMMELGAISFLLQNYYVEDWAENLMMQLVVTDLDGWWRHLGSLDLAGTYGVKAPTAPKLESWGARVTYAWDPAGVLWHIAELPGRAVV
jgi:uncharacterized glyoxalase superfamily protein PhnB